MRAGTVLLCIFMCVLPFCFTGLRKAVPTYELRGTDQLWLGQSGIRLGFCRPEGDKSVLSSPAGKTDQPRALGTGTDASPAARSGVIDVARDNLSRHTP